jgi:uncharacterized protein (TIGR02646 family)
MIPVRKQAAPILFRQIIRDNPNLTYQQFSEEEAYKQGFEQLRVELLNEQRFICCYCQNRIALYNKHKVVQMKTEHFIPKKGAEKDEILQLTYSNLLACCLGNQDSNKENHCDSSKKDKRLKVLPNPETVKQNDFDRFLKYKVREKLEQVDVIAAFQDKDLKEDINVTLNLNEQRLREKRFSAWKSIWQKIHQKGKADMNLLKEILDDFDFNVKKVENKPFCGFIISWYKERFKAELAKL